MTTARNAILPPCHPAPMETVADVAEWRVLLFREGYNMHPDDSWLGCIHYPTDTPSFTPDAACEMDRLTDAACEIVGDLCLVDLTLLTAVVTERTDR